MVLRASAMHAARCASTLAGGEAAVTFKTLLWVARVAHPAEHLKGSTCGGRTPAFSSDTGTDFGCGRARGPGRLACDAGARIALGSLSSNRCSTGYSYTAGAEQACLCGLMLATVVTTNSPECPRTPRPSEARPLPPTTGQAPVPKGR